MKWVDEFCAYDVVTEVDTWAEVQEYNKYDWTYYDKRMGLLGETINLPDVEFDIEDEFDIMMLTDEEIFALVENQ